MFQFKEFDYLTDLEIDLKITNKTSANLEKGYVPAYRYKITLHDQDQSIGEIDIRIDAMENVTFNELKDENLYYGGHIGYEIYEKYRGKHYAAKACHLIKNVALAHRMNKLIITCNPDNYASRKTCERAGLSLLEIVDLPPSNEMYQEGDRQKCRYEWILN